MKRLIVKCEADVSSVNIVDALVSQGGWEPAGDDGRCKYLRRGDDMVMDLPDLHIYVDGVDDMAAAMGFVPDVVVFPSEHTAASGMPALTVHTVGNYNEAKIGGRPGTLVPAPAHQVTNALRLIKARNSLEGFSVCFEATHHGQIGRAHV